MCKTKQLNITYFNNVSQLLKCLFNVGWFRCLQTNPRHTIHVKQRIRLPKGKINILFRGNNICFPGGSNRLLHFLTGVPICFFPSILYIIRINVYFAIK